MNEHELSQALRELNIDTLSQGDQEKILQGLVSAIQKQFLAMVHQKIGADNYAALDASLGMGPEFFITTLKHLVPDYEALYEEARRSLLATFTQK